MCSIGQGEIVVTAYHNGSFRRVDLSSGEVTHIYTNSTVNPNPNLTVVHC